MKRRTVTALALSAGLAGCAAAPYYPAVYDPPGVSPQFLATAVPMEIPPAAPDRAEIDRCIHVMATATAWAMTSTDAINACLAGPRTSVACQALPRWFAQRESIMGTWESGRECAALLDRAGIQTPVGVVKASEAFVAATKRYTKRVGS